ncbi:MAG: hypothetical protein ACRDVK_02980 [Acidimicrobiia bacterium]
MNRIRHAYLEIAPEMASYFVMSSHDDERGVALSMGLPPVMPLYQHVLAGTPTVIIVINSIIAGVIGSIAVSLVTNRSAIVALAGLIGFLISAGLHQRMATKSIQLAIGGFQPRFPSEETPG